MILTVADLREHVQSALENDALQRLLDAAEEAIVARAGAPGDRVEFFNTGGRYITLARPASALGAITEQWLSTITTLAADDYRVWPDGYTLERMTGGTHSRHHWHGHVSVTYTPLDDTATREAVQIEYCQSFLDYHPGIISETIGTWSQAFANNSAWNTSKEREDILSRLDPHGVGMVVIG